MPVVCAHAVHDFNAENKGLGIVVVGVGSFAP